MALGLLRPSLCGIRNLQYVLPDSAISEWETENMAKTIIGDSSDNFFDLSSLTESANVSLLGGNDTVIGTRFNDTVDGGDGDDQIIVNGLAQGAGQGDGRSGFRSNTGYCRR